MADQALLQLHLEPDGPIGVDELTAALGSLSRQYQSFASREAYSARPGDARLMIASVAPGSIDINFVPELVLAAGLLAPVIPHMTLIVQFAESLKRLFDVFKKGTKAEGVVGRARSRTATTRSICQVSLRSMAEARLSISFRATFTLALF